MGTLEAEKAPSCGLVWQRHFAKRMYAISDAMAAIGPMLGGSAPDERDFADLIRGTDSDWIRCKWSRIRLANSHD